MSEVSVPHGGATRPGAIAPALHVREETRMTATTGALQLFPSPQLQGLRQKARRAAIWSNKHHWTPPRHRVSGGRDLYVE